MPDRIVPPIWVTRCFRALDGDCVRGFDWMVRAVRGAFGRERLDLEAAGVLSPFEQRVAAAVTPAGAWVVVPDVVGGRR